MNSSKIVAILTAMLWLSTARAQNPKNYYIEEPKTFVGGLIGGVNFSQVDGDSYKGYNNIGFNTGVVVYARLMPQVAASIEILYAQKGAKSNGSQLSNGGNAVITKQNILLNYAEIPVQLNYFDKKKSHFGGGFSYSQLINSKEVINTNNSSVTYDQNLYPFKKMDINLVLSGQLHLYKGLFAGLRFQYSMLSIRNDVDANFGRAQQFNNVFALRLMYLFY
ncbi:MAG: PorT family protein [Chitinophagaceae bacterium]|nr:PorT family protein [Chitinophagaceae bacterium]